MPTTFQTIAGVLGNVLEWYDFALFGYFSDIISQVFFPQSENENDSGTTALVHSFAVFGGAFLMRPIGGLTIGYIGDKYGRKTALTLSLFLMAGPTFVMGCLPTYEQVGNLSIFLLVICRMLQGMSVGGQLPASLVYTVEQHDKKYWGFYGSLVMLAANIGTVLGNIVGASMRQALTEEQLVSWGWRIPFLSGILIGFVGIYLKFYGEEVVHHDDDGDGVEGHHDATHNPILSSLKRENLRSLAASMFAPMMWAAGFYTTFVWMAIYMETLLEPNPVPGAFWINAGSMVLGVTFMLPAFGHLTDLVSSRYTIMMAGSVILAIIGPIGVYIIGSTRNSVAAFVSQTIMGVALSMFGGPMCAWLVESFPRHVRLTSASLGYDLAHATAGGFSPLLATVLFDKGGIYAPGLIYPIFGLLSIGGLCLMRGSGAADDSTGEGSVENGAAPYSSAGNGEQMFDYSEGERSSSKKQTELTQIT